MHGMAAQSKLAQSFFNYLSVVLPVSEWAKSGSRRCQSTLARLSEGVSLILLDLRFIQASVRNSLTFVVRALFIDNLWSLHTSIAPTTLLECSSEATLAHKPIS